MAYFGFIKFKEKKSKLQIFALAFSLFSKSLEFFSVFAVFFAEFLFLSKTFVSGPVSSGQNLLIKKENLIFFCMFRNGKFSFSRKLPWKVMFFASCSLRENISFSTVSALARMTATFFIFFRITFRMLLMVSNGFWRSLCPHSTAFSAVRISY